MNNKEQKNVNEQVKALNKDELEQVTGGGKPVTDKDSFYDSQTNPQLGSGGTNYGRVSE